MSEEIVQLRAAEFEEAMDFLNLVFGVHRPHDFEHLLPAIYQPTDEWMGCNYAVRQNGRIRGIVGMFPIEWQVGDAVFKVAGIGGVSTHPKSRGAGYMKALMSHCVGLMREQGYHLSYLGGQRQRYQYFGYERCGSVASFALNRANLRHCFDDQPEIRFEPLAREDEARLGQARRLHDAQPVHCRRQPGNFYNHLVNWYNRPQAALDGQGRMVGYLVAGSRGDPVTELVAGDDRTALRLLRGWVAGHSEGETSIGLPAWRTGLSRLLGESCERVSVNSSGNWQIFDWAGVLDALIRLRQLSGALPEGAVAIGIEGYGTVRLAVKDGRAGAARTEEEPAVRCDTWTAMRLLFGPLPPWQVADIPAGAALLGQWCPLPLHWTSQDGI
jgi:predicted N-acetyltransferase YhbS